MKNAGSIIRVAALFVTLLFPIRRLLANEITVDHRTIQLEDTVTITVTLDDSFANIDSLRIPLRNLVLDGAPSVSSQFEWINGQTSRRKVFRYAAHPNATGEAVVGPLTLHGGGGEVETLAPIAIQVLPDAAAGTNDPAKILREMVATNRDPIVLIAEADKDSVFAGEEVVVTWTLYNATSVQQFAIAEIPKLEDFWTEELDVRGEQPEQVILGGMVVQKVPIRRVALFPLHAGTVVVPAMGVNASILKRVRTSDPFGLFEGMEVDVHRRSSPLSIRAQPVPPGPPVMAVGDVALRCNGPLQRNGGPVIVDVALTGRANLRAATPPVFESAPDATVQIVEGRVTVDRTHADATMTRRWRILMFPARPGGFAVPALSATVLTPMGVRREIRCEAATLTVRAATPQEPPPRLASVRRGLTTGVLTGWVATGMVIIALIALASARSARTRRMRALVRGLTRPAAGETRDAVDAYLVSRGFDPQVLLREPSDRGDAYRSLRSLLDSLERDRLPAVEGEIERRVRDVVAA